MDPATVAPGEHGRDAFNRHAWIEALEAFGAADQDGGLSPDDLEVMGQAAWWSGNPDQATDPLERAFAAYVEDGRPINAARVAFLLSYMAFRRLVPSVGAGWSRMFLALTVPPVMSPLAALMASLPPLTE